MSDELAVADFYERLHQRIDTIRWIAGAEAAALTLDAAEARSGGIGLAGNLNLIHSNQVQLIGCREMEYLDGLPTEEFGKVLDQIFSGRTRIIVLADDVSAPKPMVERCDTQPVALFSSSLRGHELLSEIQFLLSHELAEQVTLHGVFLDVAGMGTLLTGGAGTGKSELALELVTRGHRLVADDAPVFSRVSPTTLSGACPELLQDFLEVRGLGVINIRAMFGDAAIKQSKYLRLIVNLTPLSQVRLGEENRLVGLCGERKILGIKIPEVTLPVAPGRDIAVLIEAAARNQALKANGYFAAEDFRVRLRNRIISE
ncbi:MAG TPA: HPr(Ser) kinase/phosphatase [Gammaproteobacteria bacterium]|nr:HPr(Ser) kinase/phosphatase [Gammaproteobacteria bacterium]